VSEYSEIVFQKYNGLCATWNHATTYSTKSDYSDTLLADKVAPNSLIKLVPAVAVTVPPQLPLSPLGVEITRPDGSVSLKPIPVSVVEPLLFWILKVSEV
jgi:hypothetical protein